MEVLREHRLQNADHLPVNVIDGRGKKQESADNPAKAKRPTLQPIITDFGTGERRHVASCLSRAMLPAQVLNGKDEQKLAVKLNFRIVAFFAILFDLIAKLETAPA